MARDEVRRHFRGDNYALTTELGGAGDHITPLAEDVHAESAAITTYPNGISVMPVSAAASWDGWGLKATVVTTRTSSGGRQEISVEDEFASFGYREWISATSQWATRWYYPFVNVPFYLRPVPTDQNAESNASTAWPEGLSIMYVTAGANWGPNTGEAGWVVNETKTTDSTGKQTLTIPSTGTSYTRYYAGGAWGSWIDVTAVSAHAATHTNGTDDIQNATAGQKGLATATQITKLDGIEPGATADQTAAEILTAVKTVDGSGSGLDADTVDGVEASALVQTTRTISTTAPLTGGGDLSANRTLAVSAASDTVAGVVELSTDAELATGSDTTRATTPANIASRGFERTANKDTNSGYIGRGSSGQASVPYLDLPEQAGATPSADTGRVYGLDVGGKTDLEYRDSTGVVARPFRDSYFVAQNTTGSTIAKGSAVRVSGQSASGIPLIALADADALATMPAAGITMESITTTSYGRVMIQGILTGLNTSGLSAGTPVYASGTAGGITGTAPVYPAFRQVLGSVMSVNATTGELFVNVAHFFRQVGTPMNTTFFYGSTLAVTTGVGRAPITTNTAGTITEVRATVNTAPTGAAINLSVKKNGSSFATPSIAAGANAGSSTSLSTAVAAGDYITVDITQIGSTIAGSDLVVTVEIMTAN